MASPQLPTTSYAMLGLLEVSSMSGYDLAQAADRSIANFWPVSRSQVYGELARLERLGYLRGTDVAQERLPDKRVFEITDEGKRMLHGWLATPGYESERMRLGFCVKMFFGHHMPRETMTANLQSFRDHARARSEYLAQIVDMLSTLPAAMYARATAELGRRISDAALGWAEEMLASLPESEHAHDEKDEKMIHEKARQLFEKVPPRLKTQ